MYADVAMRLAIAVLFTAALFPAGIPVKPGHAAPPTSVLRLRNPVPGCPVCDLWLRYEDVVLQARQEVGGLQAGVFYFYHAEDPATIEGLIRFAHDRAELETQLRKRAALRRSLGEVCGHRYHAGSVHLEISTSARGMFALLTDQNPSIQAELRAEAGRAVRGKIPVWF